MEIFWFFKIIKWILDDNLKVWKRQTKNIFQFWEILAILNPEIGKIPKNILNSKCYIIRFRTQLFENFHTRSIDSSYQYHQLPCNWWHAKKLKSLNLNLTLSILHWMEILLIVCWMGVPYLCSCNFCWKSIKTWYYPRWFCMNCKDSEQILEAASKCLHNWTLL